MSSAVTETGLLFNAGFRLEWKLLRENLPVVVALATAGVGLTTLVVAVLDHWVLGLAIPFAVLLGAMVAPTDPVMEPDRVVVPGTPDLGPELRAEAQQLPRPRGEDQPQVSEPGSGRR